VPSYFTRAEKPYNYAYTDKKCPDKVEDTETEKDVLFQRKSRSLPTIRYIFGLNNEMPTEPQEHAVDRKNQRLIFYPQLEEELEAIKKVLIVFIIYP
jgi:hypothetical protein